MKPGFRISCIMLIIFIMLVITFPGCMHKRASVAGLVSSSPLASLPGDKKIIVAKVNGAEITRYSLIDSMNRLSEINQRMSINEPRETTRKKALDQLVLQELALQEAARQGLLVEDAFLDRAMEQVITNFGHEEGYQIYLEKQNLTPVEFRGQVERSLIIQLIFDREVIKKTRVPEDDVRKEYERQKDRFLTPAKVTVEDVVIFLDQDDPALMTKANEILANIKADKDKDPKNLVADKTFIVRSLDIDKEKEPVLYDAALKLKPGELSGVIRTRDSVHIIQLTQYIPEKQLSYEEVKGSLEGKFRAEAQKIRRQEWERELKTGAKIEIRGPEAGAQGPGAGKD